MYKTIARHLLAVSVMLAVACGAPPADVPEVGTESAALQKKHIANVKEAPADPAAVSQLEEAAVSGASGTESFGSTCRALCDSRYNTCMGLAGSSTDQCLCYNARVRCYWGCGVSPRPFLRSC